MTVDEHRDPLSSEVKPREGAVGQHPPDIQVQTPRLLRAWQVAAFTLAIVAGVWAAMCFVYAQRAFFGSDVQIVLGDSYDHTRFNSSPAHRITSLEPYSPLLSAGVQVGDLIVDPPLGTLLPGERVRLQIRHDGASRSVAIRNEQVGQELLVLAGNVLELCLGTLLLILGLTIAFRRRRDVAALATACALLLGASIMLLPTLPVGRLAALARLWGNLGPLVFAALAYSVLTFEGGYRSRARTYLVRILIGICAVFGTWFIMIAAPYLLGWAWMPPLLVIGIAAEIALLALCVAALADAWRHSEGERRQRLRWLLLAFSIFLVGFGLFIAPDLGAFENTVRASLSVLIARTIVFAVATITLTYAVVRHRVIDVGFVISRTLVFAVFTGLLLVMFAAVEWLVDHLVHFRQRESSFLLDGAIAVAIYLIFHRVRNWIERLVERLFFRASRARQTALQHFLETAPNFSEPDALAGALLKAVDAYAGSRGSGIYRRDKTGRFVLEKSTLDQLPRILTADAEVIIELKTSHKPYQFGRLSFELTALALPVVRRAELVGFLAVAEKTDRTMFRPDEIESLLRALHQVNSDLHALQLEQLVQQNEASREELRSLGPSSTSLAKSS